MHESFSSYSKGLVHGLISSKLVNESKCLIMKMNSCAMRTKIMILNTLKTQIQNQTLT